MWIKGNNNIKKVSKTTQDFLNLQGELTEEEARATLAEFLYNNPSFMLDMIGDIELLPFQEIVIKGWMQNNFSLAVWGRGIGKTLVYNHTSILLSRDHGLITLPNLLPNVDFSKEGWVDIPDIYLWNGNGWQLTSKIYVQPQKKCQKVITRDGYELSGSTRHLIKVLNMQTLEVEWRRYSDIKIGDYICISHNEVEWGGDVSQGELRKAYECGLSGQNHISKEILSNKSLLREFLIGSFENYGCAVKDLFCYQSISKELTHQIQVALLTFGIFSEKIDGDLYFDSKFLYTKLIKNEIGEPAKDSFSLVGNNESFAYSQVEKISYFKYDCLDFNVPVGNQYWSNGFISHNSFTTSLFVMLWALFNPNNRIVIVSTTFRVSRSILEQIEKFIKNKNAPLLKACFPEDIRRGTDEWQLKLPNGATIRCLPLGDGTKIRSIRADTLIVDEFAYVPESVIAEVLQPFLVANNDIKERRRLERLESEKIAQGLMKEEDRTKIEENIKVVFLSSASYQFEHLYKRYCNWVGMITDDKMKDDIIKSGSSYCVTRMSYEAAPEGLVKTKAIEEARQSTSEAVFDREYRAIFTADSGGFFKMSKMVDCTIPDGDDPTLELVGEKGFEYILAIDVALSGADNSDHFAMCVLKLVTRETDKKVIPMVVHTYAVAGADLKDHITYFHYIVTRFNIVYIAIDASQGDNVEFLNASVQSEMFKRSKIELCDLDVDFKKDNFAEWPELIKRSYNRTIGRIVQKQPFNAPWQRAANEYLQGCFDRKDVLFAGKIAANNRAAASAYSYSVQSLGIESCGEFADMSPKQLIENQDALIDMTKKECASIKASITDLGTMQFKLPQNVRRSSGPNRMRRDSYSALFLGVWAAKMYLESKTVEQKCAIPDFPYQFVDPYQPGW